MNSKTRNASMLQGSLAKHGYDWWWHSLVAQHATTGEYSSFFMEYYVINPGLATPEPVFGQAPGAQKPCYAMIKAGKWGSNKAQIHNFWPVHQVHASTTTMDVRIGPNIATEDRLVGSVALSPEDAKAHPEYMSDPGTMSWDLQVRKELSYSVGYGASAPFRAVNAFEMFWHVGGMKTSYQGTIIYGGETWIVSPDTCGGYQDKNWGTDYTSPWIWLSCNRFFDGAGGFLPDTSLDIGGGKPKLWGMDLGEKVLAAFYHKGRLHEFNFSKILHQKQRWQCTQDADHVYWSLDLENRTHRLVVDFSCAKETMLLVNYENPAGQKNHKQLWNGGNAKGNLKLYLKSTGELCADLWGDMGGCEYGRVA